MTRKILCVDDEANITALFTELLSAKGHTVSVARDGVEAIAHATATQFDVVITDHQMPRMTGLELVRHLRAAHIRARFLSSRARCPRRPEKSMKR